MEECRIKRHHSARLLRDDLWLRLIILLQYCRRLRDDVAQAVGLLIGVRECRDSPDPELDTTLITERIYSFYHY